MLRLILGNFICCGKVRKLAKEVVGSVEGE